MTIPSVNPNDSKSFDLWWSESLLNGKSSQDLAEEMRRIGSEIALIRAAQIQRYDDRENAIASLRKPLISSQKEIRLLAVFQRTQIEYSDSYRMRGTKQASHFSLALKNICEETEQLFPNAIAVETKARALKLLALCCFDGGQIEEAASFAYQAKIYAESLEMNNFLNLATIEYANYLACLGELRRGVQELSRISAGLENNIEHLKLSFVYRAVMNLWLGQDRIALSLANSFDPDLHFWRDYILCMTLERNFFNVNGYASDVLPTHSEVSHYHATSLLASGKTFENLLEVEKLTVGHENETHFTGYSNVLRGISAVYRREYRMARNLLNTEVGTEYFLIRGLQAFAKLELELRNLESVPEDMGVAFDDVKSYLNECNDDQLYSIAHKSRILAPRALAVIGHFSSLGTVIEVFGKQITFRVDAKVKLNGKQVQPLHVAVATLNFFGISEQHHYNSLQRKQIESATIIQTKNDQYAFEPNTPASVVFAGKKLIECNRIPVNSLHLFGNLDRILPKTMGFEIEKRRKLGEALETLCKPETTSEGFVQLLKVLQL